MFPWFKRVGSGGLSAVVGVWSLLGVSARWDFKSELPGQVVDTELPGSIRPPFHFNTGLIRGVSHSPGPQ